MSTKPTSRPSPPEPGDVTETPDLQGAYPRLSDAQIAALTGQGDRRGTQPGEILFGEGERDCDFYVVLAGHMASVEGHGTHEERIISAHGRGRFLGELSLLTGEGSFYTAMALDAGEVLAVSVARLRELIARDPAFGDLVLRAYLLRRSILIGLGVGLRVIGSRYSPDTRRVRDFAARNRIPVRWLDLETDPTAEAMLAQFGVTRDDTPIVIVYGRLLRNPGNAELAAAIGLPAPSAQQAGPTCSWSGPAGGPVRRRVRRVRGDAGDRPRRRGHRRPGRNLIADRELPRIPLGGTPGAELADRAVLQAEKFGARFAVPAEATALAQDSGYYRVELTDGTSLTSTSVGGHRHRRPIPSARRPAPGPFREDERLLRGLAS